MSQKYKKPNIVVKNIDYKDESRMMQELRDLGKIEIIKYINALKNVIEAQKETNRLAIKKITKKID
jgi:hypothetical protein